jgi:hypothetical protein
MAGPSGRRDEFFRRLQGAHMENGGPRPYKETGGSTLTEVHRAISLPMNGLDRRDPLYWSEAVKWIEERFPRGGGSVN